eukprot:TRINITY_DN21705_c1_g1_i4.p2 TRINITY_DN21705_c1_g1~~TRINITY_DN21705_c1_g1_i4.p2  ORF type:complete len:440 (+),score=67.65 TRINITY_DN21705_c1_g1_i4:651-1970(+)
MFQNVTFPFAKNVAAFLLDANITDWSWNHEGELINFAEETAEVSNILEILGIGQAGPERALVIECQAKRFGTDPKRLPLPDEIKNAIWAKAGAGPQPESITMFADNNDVRWRWTAPESVALAFLNKARSLPDFAKHFFAVNATALHEEEAGYLCLKPRQQRTTRARIAEIVKKLYKDNVREALPLGANCLIVRLKDGTVSPQDLSKQLWDAEQVGARYVWKQAPLFVARQSWTYRQEPAMQQSNTQVKITATRPMTEGQAMAAAALFGKIKIIKRVVRYDPFAIAPELWVVDYSNHNSVNLAHEVRLSYGPTIITFQGAAPIVSLADGESLKQRIELGKALGSMEQLGQLAPAPPAASQVDGAQQSTTNEGEQARHVEGTQQAQDMPVDGEEAVGLVGASTDKDEFDLDGSEESMGGDAHVDAQTPGEGRKKKRRKRQV